ncbi:MAG: 30S ribosomal protein S16 [Anaerolineales bacterium]|jgi:small subunit ribosomal protein S16|nr:30S ribosomal protein S16 [Anaerolineales bacterium]
MVRIRFRREGSRHQPVYRLVVSEKESPRDGRFLEIIGHYNPRTQPATMVVKEDRLMHWLQAGAQPSESALKVLKTCGAWERWERIQKGEAVDEVLASRPAAVPVDPRTKREPGASGKPSKKKLKKEEQPSAP